MDYSTADTALCIFDAMNSDYPKEFAEMREELGFCELRNKLISLAQVLDQSYEDITQRIENPGLPWDYEIVPGILAIVMGKYRTIFGLASENWDFFIYRHLWLSTAENELRQKYGIGFNDGIEPHDFFVLNIEDSPEEAVDRYGTKHDLDPLNSFSKTKVS